jgi:transcriptional regulator with XRE-family HTH domain
MTRPTANPLTSQAEAIRQARNAKGMTQDHLAKAAGVSDRTVKRAESGEAISDETMLAIAAVLEMDVGTIRRTTVVSVDELVEMASCPSDTPQRRKNLEAIAHHCIDHVPGIKAMIAPDVEGFVKVHGPLGIVMRQKAGYARTAGIILTAFSLHLLFIFEVLGDRPQTPESLLKIYGLLFSLSLAAWVSYVGALAADRWELRNAKVMANIRSRRESLAYAVSGTHLHEIWLEGDRVRDVRHSLDKLNRWSKVEIGSFFDYRFWFTGSRFGLMPRRERIRAVRDCPEFDAALTSVAADRDFVYRRPGVSSVDVDGLRMWPIYRLG